MLVPRDIFRVVLIALSCPALFVAGCRDVSEEGEVRFVETILQARDKIPADLDVRRNLASSVGRRIALVGIADRNAKPPVLSVSDMHSTVALTLTDQKSWQDAPSPRSTCVLVIGLLTKARDAYNLQHTTYTWLDR